MGGGAETDNAGNKQKYDGDACEGNAEKSNNGDDDITCYGSNADEQRMTNMATQCYPNDEQGAGADDA